MFVMTSDIFFINTAKKLKSNAVKANHIKWTRKVDNICDSATIKLPAIAMLKKDGDTYERVETGLQLTEGMKVEIYAGYNGKNELRFKGFIKRRVFAIPLELECEGYSYQLGLKQDFTCSHKSITLKELLQDLTKGTDIILSDKLPSLTLSNIRFKNATGIEVLQYLKDKCLLTVHFDFDVLQVGLKMTDVKSTINLRLDWNTVKDDDLKFEQNRELAKVNIKIEKRDKTGNKKKAVTEVKDASVKTLQVRHILDEKSLKAIADQKRSELLTKGYEGKVTGFLFPYAEPGMAASITDNQYPERSGLYFIESIEGEFGSNGGRQKIGIGVQLNG